MLATKRAFGILLLALLVPGYSADAAVIKISYNGTVTSVGDPHLGTVDAALGGAFSVGDAVTGIVTFDTTTPQNFSSANEANYGGAVKSFLLKVGSSYTTGATGGLVLTQDDHQAGSSAPTRDGLFFMGLAGLSGDPIGSLQLDRLQFSLLAANLATLNDLLLPDVSDIQAMWTNNVANGNTNFLSFGVPDTVRYSLSSVTEHSENRELS